MGNEFDIWAQVSHCITARGRREENAFQNVVPTSFIFASIANSYKLITVTS